MAKLLTWNLSRLKTKSRVMTGPLPEMYVRDLTRMVEELQGVYLSGIQVGDARRFAIPNPRFKAFPVLYNPEIVEQYDLVASEGEGCLSFPGLWVKIPRYKYVTVKFRDGQWKEQTVTYGSEETESEESLLAKAIQHEIFHMDGVVIHDRIKDFGKRMKVYAQILKHSLEQNKTKGIPVLGEGPAELDPSNLPVVTSAPDSAILEETNGTVPQPQELLTCALEPEKDGLTMTSPDVTQSTGQCDTGVLAASDSTTE
jgi:peptide deformylase